MTELLIGALTRWALTIVSAYLVAHHVLTAAEGDTLLAHGVNHAVLAAPAIIALVWTIAQKYRSRVLLLTALQSPAGTTEARLKDSVDAGFGVSLTKGGPPAAAIILLACLPLATMNASCASGGMPPPGTYDAAGTKAFKADQLLKDVRAAGQTARNLNAVSGAGHLSDLDTAHIRDFSLVAGAGLNAWGSGATTLNAARASIDAANLPPGNATTLRAAFDQAVIDHGGGASTLTIVIDVYKVLRARISVSASQNPKLTAILGAVDAGIASIPAQ
jgi:hypothetical protein